MEQQIRCQIYFVFKTFWFSIGLTLVLTAIFGSIAIAMKSPIMGVCGFLLALFLPAIFMRKIKALFTKEALVIFGNLNFSISTFRVGKEDELKTYSFEWETMKSYKIYFTPRGLTYLDVFLRNGKFKEFAFKEGKTLEECLNSDGPSLMKLFRFYVKEYNRQSEKNSKIVLSPGLLTTKVGTFWLILIGVLIVIAILLLVIIKGSSPAFLLIGLGAYLPLLAKRRSDMAFYRKMSELDSVD